MRQKKRISVPLLALVLSLQACGVDPLSRAGSGSTDWIGEGAPSTVARLLPATTTTFRTPRPIVDLGAAVGLYWTNDHLATFNADTPSGISGLVWDASDGTDSHVQANRTSIARALPGIKVPAVVPTDVLHVTSQLVYEPGGLLTGDWVAAFGFWTATPYLDSRATSQSAVLHVGTFDTGPGSSTGCALFAQGSVGCQDVVVAGLGEASEESVPDGVRLSWVDGSYRYELFYRTVENPEVVELMAGAMVELTDLESHAALVFRGLISKASPASPPAE